MQISIHSSRFDFSTADLRKITTKHKAKYKKALMVCFRSKRHVLNCFIFSDYDKFTWWLNLIEWYEIIPCTQDVIIYLHSIPFPPPFSHYFCLSNIFMYTFIILCNLLSFSYLCTFILHIHLLYRADILSWYNLFPI